MTPLRERKPDLASKVDRSRKICESHWKSRGPGGVYGASVRILISRARPHAHARAENKRSLVIMTQSGAQRGAQWGETAQQRPRARRVRPSEQIAEQLPPPRGEGMVALLKRLLKIR